MRTFRAWINETGDNADLRHKGCHGPCRHLRLVDLETNGCRILLRFIWRRRPFYFQVIEFIWPKMRLWRTRPFYVGRTVIRIGRRLKL